jgi:hypothetical protein
MLYRSMSMMLEGRSVPVPSRIITPKSLPMDHPIAIDILEMTTRREEVEGEVAGGGKIEAAAAVDEDSEEVVIVVALGADDSISAAAVVFSQFGK